MNSAGFIVFQSDFIVKLLFNANVRQRLQKILRDNLGISRRKAEGLIEKGKVSINGNISKLGDLADPLTDDIVYQGKRLKSEEPKKLTYIMLNKPSGYLTSRFDPHHKKTVYDLLPKQFDHLFPVGRLDQDTEGLLLLTNDGDLTYMLTHPKYEVEKEYLVFFDGKIKPEEILQIEKGIKLSDTQTSGSKIKLLRSKNSETKLTIVIHEGQNRIIRRIFGHFHYAVKYLKRLRIKNLRLDTLESGKWRYLTDREVHSLQQSTAF